MQKVNEYVNKDLYGKSTEEFNKALDLDIDLEKEPLIGKIEWALMLLDMESSPIRFSEARVDFNLKVYDGAWLMSERFDSSNPNFIDPFGNYFDSSEFNSKLFENFNFKTLMLNDNIQLQKWKSLTLEEKRGICLPNETAFSTNLSFATKEKWYNNQTNYKVVDVFKTNCKEKNLIIEVLKNSGIKVGNDINIEGQTFSWEGFVKKTLNQEYLLPITSKKGYTFDNKSVLDYTSDSDYENLIQRYRMMLSCALTYHYEWCIYIKEHEKSIGFKVPITPESYNDIFSIRDVTKSGRKKAILHFVSEHYRNSTKKASYDTVQSKTLINKYLRGETEFNWNGLKVSLIPSKSDIINTKTKKNFIDI